MNLPESQLDNVWDGYRAQGTYLKKIYPEYLPHNIDFALAISNCGYPQSPFVYCDFGCGFGLTVIMAALINPNSTFIGVDLNAEHISYANGLVEQLNLSNCHFLCATFEQSKDEIRNRFGKLSYITAHGVFSWVSESQRHILLQTVSELLAENGVMVTSFNSSPGWLVRSMFQKLLVSGIDDSDQEQSVQKTKDIYQKICKTAASFNELFPLEHNLFQDHYNKPSNYLLHEYAHDGWEPNYVTDVWQLHETYGLVYQASLLYPENFMQFLPKAHKELVEGLNTPMAALVTDIATVKSFRKDIFKRQDGKDSTSRDRFLSTHQFALVDKERLKKTTFSVFNYKADLTEPVKQLISKFPIDQSFHLEIHQAANQDRMAMDLALLVTESIISVLPIETKYEDAVHRFNRFVAENVLRGHFDIEFIAPRTLTPLQHQPTVKVAVAGLVLSIDRTNFKDLSNSTRQYLRQLFPKEPAQKIDQFVSQTIHTKSQLIHKLNEQGFFRKS